MKHLLPSPIIVEAIATWKAPAARFGARR